MIFSYWYLKTFIILFENAKSDGCPGCQSFYLAECNTECNNLQFMYFFIWTARITVTVDGGTQRWLKYLEDQGIDLLNGEHEQYVPDLITGDMDSCPPPVIEKLGSIGSTVIKTPDQNHTDYTKALLQLAHYAKKRNINVIRFLLLFLWNWMLYMMKWTIFLAVRWNIRACRNVGQVWSYHRQHQYLVQKWQACGKYTGEVSIWYRLAITFSCCVCWSRLFSQVIQVASNSLTWMLKPGLHSIHIPESLIQQKSWCALLPFGCPVNCISTTGLKWNLSMFHISHFISK